MGSSVIKVNSGLSEIGRLAKSTPKSANPLSASMAWILESPEIGLKSVSNLFIVEEFKLRARMELILNSTVKVKWRFLSLVLINVIRS
jgi:hypothetical protein